MGAGRNAGLCAHLVLLGRAGRLFLPEHRFCEPQRRSARPCKLSLARVLPKQQRWLWQPRRAFCFGVLHLPLAASGPGGQSGAGGDGRRGRCVAGGKFCAVFMDEPWRLSCALPACGHVAAAGVAGCAFGVCGLYGLQRAGYRGHGVDASGRRLSYRALGGHK